jgi:hypothetical protein
MIKNTVDTFASKSLSKEEVEVLNIRSDIEKEKSLDEKQALPLKFDASVRKGLDEQGNPTQNIPNAYGNGDEFIVIQRMLISRIMMRQIMFIAKYNLKTMDDVKKLDITGVDQRTKDNILFNYNKKGIERLAEFADIIESVNLHKLTGKNYYVKLKVIQNGKIEYKNKKSQIPSIKDNNNIGESIDSVGTSGTTLNEMIEAIMVYDETPVVGIESKRDLISLSSMFKRLGSDGNKYNARDTIISEENLDKLNAICEAAVRTDVLDLDASFVNEISEAQKILEETSEAERILSEEETVPVDEVTEEEAAKEVEESKKEEEKKEELEEEEVGEPKEKAPKEMKSDVKRLLRDEELEKRIDVSGIGEADLSHLDEGYSVGDVDADEIPADVAAEFTEEYGEAYDEDDEDDDDDYDFDALAGSQGGKD